MEFNCYKEHNQHVIACLVEGRPINVECPDDKVVEAMSATQEIICGWAPKGVKLAIAAKVKKVGFVMWTFNTPWLHEFKTVEIT